MLMPLKTILLLLCLTGLIGITVVSLVGQFSRNRHLELMAHFQPQYTAVALGLTLALVGSSWVSGSSEKPGVWIALLCLSLNGASILPWYIPSRSPSLTSTVPLRVLVVNVNGRNRQHQEVVSMVKEEEPDLAIFIEVNRRWSNHLQQLRLQFPYHFGDADHPIQGVILYSRFPLENPKIEFWGMSRNPSLMTDVVLPERRISLIAAHPLPPMKSNHFDGRNQQLEAIAQWIQSLNTPVILVGDLNITPWSFYYRRLVHQTGLHNARKGFGLLPTWSVHPRYQGTPRWVRPLFWIPIDHCLVSPGIQVKQSHTGSYVGSDHLPLITDLNIPTQS